MNKQRKYFDFTRDQNNLIIVYQVTSPDIKVVVQDEATGRGIASLAAIAENFAAS